MKSYSKIKWLFPILFVLYEISIYLSNDMYLPALPDMMRDLQLSATEAQLTVTMWFVGSACTPLIMGALADRYGRRPTLLIGGIIYVLSTMMCAIANNEYTLLSPRIIEGAMVSSMMVSGYAVIHESFEHKEAIQILAIMGGISVLAPALGPLFGAMILIVAPWRWIFWIIAIFATVLLLFLYRYMHETLSPDKRQPLNFTAILKNYWEVVANRNFQLLMIVQGLLFAGFISWVTTGPMLVIASLQFSAVAFGWMQLAVFASYILGTCLVNWLLEKSDAYRLVNAGLFISLIGGLSALASSLLTTQFYYFLISIIVYSFGSALSFAPLNRLVIETSDKPMGIRVALFTAGFMSSGALGSGIASFIYNGTAFSLGILIACSVVAACLLQFIYYGLNQKVSASH